MKGKQISLIYFYLVSIIGIVLLVVGIYNVVTYTINVTQYDNYPLRYQETDCDVNPYQFGGPTPYKPNGEPTPASPSAENVSAQVASCKKQQALLRKQQQFDDLRSSIVFTGAGLVLFIIHFYMARKHSKD
jgi:hypothetical protein